MPSGILPPISRKSIFQNENPRKKSLNEQRIMMRGCVLLLHFVQAPHPRERIPNVELIVARRKVGAATFIAHG
jgi:hypothetical protein